MIWRLVRRSEGQATLEAALVFPLLLLLVIGMVGLALLLHASTMTTLAANRAARVGAVAYGDNGLTPEEQYQRTVDAANSVVGSALASSTCTIEPVSSAEDLSVTVRCQIGLSLPWIRDLLGANRWVTSHTAVYRIEVQ